MTFATSRIELSRSALTQNLGYLRRHVGSQTVFCSVVKGNAYGHGIEDYVPLAEECGVRCFAVFSADEAYRVACVKKDESQVMIMGDMHPDAIEWAIAERCSFYVFDNMRLDHAVTAARRLEQPALIHLEVETGLNRTGLDGDALERALTTIGSHPDLLHVEGICTHFAGAETIGNYYRIQQQIEEFARQLRFVQAHGIDPRLQHTACSAAALAYPGTIKNLVRIGIAQFGFWPSQEIRMQVMHKDGVHQRQRDPLRRVMRWVSRIMHVKDVGPGQFVGYGIAYQTSRRQRLAAVPVGYYHGFARQLSNLGHVLISGRRAQVVGNVNMNMMMVDITDIPSAKAGDEVVIIGRQKRSSISVASFTDLTRYLNYEVLARLAPDIPRAVVD